ncbi:hypothetical protein BLNAU_10767 [Blattamonas nauphoetae]|uniref:Uncharacterized protein n=1 Tax=Blattamonas nauphoetae TaxID=2049346 RepID=A0ABQ9XPC6_9EUKA|nr:hypothetical protein BLNAU_10767 [Blattamonas nauphoetae]
MDRPPSLFDLDDDDDGTIDLSLSLVVPELNDETSSLFTDASLLMPHSQRLDSHFKFQTLSNPKQALFFPSTKMGLNRSSIHRLGNENDIKSVLALNPHQSLFNSTFTLPDPSTNSSSPELTRLPFVLFPSDLSRFPSSRYSFGKSQVPKKSQSPTLSPLYPRRRRHKPDLFRPEEHSIKLPRESVPVALPRISPSEIPVGAYSREIHEPNEDISLENTPKDSFDEETKTFVDQLILKVLQGSVPDREINTTVDPATSSSQFVPTAIEGDKAIQARIQTLAVINSSSEL